MKLNCELVQFIYDEQNMCIGIRIFFRWPESYHTPRNYLRLPTKWNIFFYHCVVDFSTNAIESFEQHIFSTFFYAKAIYKQAELQSDSRLTIISSILWLQLQALQAFHFYLIIL